MNSASGIWTGSAALLAAAPLALLGPCKSEAVIVSTDCIEVTAAGIRGLGGGGLSIRGASVEAGDQTSSGVDCDALKGATFVAYDEENGQLGFQGSDVNPEDPDTLVSSQSGQLDQPSGTIQIGSFTTKGSDGTTADSWETTILTDKGNGECGTSTFQGSF